MGRPLVAASCTRPAPPAAPGRRPESDRRPPSVASAAFTGSPSGSRPPSSAHRRVRLATCDASARRPVAGRAPPGRRGHSAAPAGGAVRSSQAAVGPSRRVPPMLAGPRSRRCELSVPALSINAIRARRAEQCRPDAGRPRRSGITVSPVGLERPVSHVPVPVEPWPLRLPDPVERRCVGASVENANTMPRGLRLSDSGPPVTRRRQVCYLFAGEHARGVVRFATCRPNEPGSLLRSPGRGEKEP